MTEPVSLMIGGKAFLCVPIANADFKDVAAIYVILDVKKDGNWSVVDIGQSGEVGTRIDSHDRRVCWEKNSPNGNIWVCVYTMPASNYTKQDREELEHKLRVQYVPPCGKR